MQADPETAVLFCMIDDAESCARGLRDLSETDFSDKRNRELFAAIKRCAKEGGKVDLVTLRRFTSDGCAYAAALPYYPASNFGSYMDALLAENRRRRSVEKLKRALAAAEGNAEGWEALAEEAAFAAKCGRSSGIEYVGADAIDALSALYRNDSGIKTAFPLLDACTKGLCRKRLYVLAARPGMGKTSFAMNLALRAAKEGNVTAVFSLEMGKEELLQRAAFSRSAATERDLLLQKEDAVESAAFAAEDIASMPLYINDTAAIGAAEISRICYALKQEKGSLGLVVVDYLQLISGSGNKNATREQVVSEISRRMKLLAKELDVPVLLLSQLSRGIEHREDKRPMLSDLRESGAIEQDADVVMFISPTEDEADNRRLVTVAKNRSGKTTGFEVGWKGDIYRFYALSRKDGAA